MVNKIPQVLVCTDVHLKLKHPLSMTWMLLQVLNIYIYISRHKVDILILCRRRYARGYLVRIRANIHNLYEEISRHFISWAFRSSQKKQRIYINELTFYLHTRNKLFFVYSILGIHSRCLLFAFHCSPQVLIRLWNFATSALQIRFISFLGFCWEGLHLI